MEYKINTYINNEGNSCRFVLGLDNSNPLIVLGVNPSTADDTKPDATIRRVIGYAQRNGFDGFLMINLYPVRSTNPHELPQDMNTDIHQQNIEHIIKVFSQHPQGTILAAYGNTIGERSYLKKCLYDIIKESLHFNLKWMQIGELTKSGNPRHPSRGPYIHLQVFNINNIL